MEAAIEDHEDVGGDRERRARLPANDTATTPEETAVEIAVLANDTEPNGDTLLVGRITVPAHGTAVVKSNGTMAARASTELQRARLFRLHDR